MAGEASRTSTFRAEATTKKRRRSPRRQSAAIGGVNSGAWEMNNGYILPAAVCGLMLSVGTEAVAQVQIGLAPFAPFQGYDRGRNVSVLSRERPEYAAIGIRS